MREKYIAIADRMQMQPRQVSMPSGWLSIHVGIVTIMK